MSQPKIACVNCINWIPPFITSTGKLIDATCKVEKCCPLYTKSIQHTPTAANGGVNIKLC